ncbi:cold shock domain-containing protein [Salipiger sp. P9]|uniref:cold shock domain-containing protein n=1 Tax=Salipiger pentaromativorans TaxID=2943193 RepID=UPI002157BEE1|nr:cold shock domain-containing protein [Salipiger pentaromativorans]MCR8546301.1 cold shock domain-containing protein [Salipiger pentaromativorans]
MSQKMYGVVLWADHRDQKAVIWCEDHGDLAFYHDTGVSAHDGLSLDAGDLIQFDLKQEHNLRYARNPERLAHQQYAGLAQNLRSADRGRGAGAPRPAGIRPAGNIVPFPGQRMLVETLQAS